MQNTLDRGQLTKLVDEVKMLRDWTIVRDFCDQVYGPGRVATASLETHGEYNDEGGTDYSVEDVLARDGEGNVLEYDLSLPFWLNAMADGERHYDDAQENAQDALRDWYRKSDEPETIQWLAWNDLPCDVHDGGDEIYELTQQPKLSFAIMDLDHVRELIHSDWKSS